MMQPRLLQWKGPGPRHIRKASYYTGWRAESIIGPHIINLVEHCTTPKAGYPLLPYFESYYTTGSGIKHQHLLEAMDAIQADFDAKILSELVK